MNATAEAPKMPQEFRFMCKIFHLGLIFQAPRDQIEGVVYNRPGEVLHRWTSGEGGVEA
jgi:hypothetical protein